jgi:hypothetical protein
MTNDFVTGAVLEVSGGETLFNIEDTATETRKTNA